MFMIEGLSSSLGNAYGVRVTPQCSLVKVVVVKDVSVAEGVDKGSRLQARRPEPSWVVRSA